MSLEYIDESRYGGADRLKLHDISRLISSYMEPEDCTEAVRQSFRIVELLLLSNHLEHANALASGLYQHMDTILPANTSRPTSPPLNYFWFTHPAYPCSDNALPQPRVGDGSPESSKRLAQYEHQQWQSYRECTRTGWMLDDYDLAEPDDPHVWRKTDNAPMIGMCARLLAKDKNPGQYPPVETLREALAASEKLYAQPQVPIDECELEFKESKRVCRHSALLYRRLVVELAIRVGRLETAADVLSQGLRLDGFSSMDGAALDRFLMLPGIYEVLPILAAKGKAGNPFFVAEKSAAAIVQEITKTLERRAEHGRQWSLAPERVGWKELLDRLANAAWAVNSKEYEKSGIMRAVDILNDPASEEDIQAAEAKFGQLPDDLKEMFRVADGFKGGWHFLEGGLGRCALIDFDCEGDGYDDLVNDNGLDFPDDSSEGIDPDTAVILLSPGTECDSYRHCLVLPATYRKLAQGRDDYRDGEYRYWYTSYWLCENDWHNSIRDWVAHHVEALERRVEDGDIERGSEDGEE